MKIKTLLLIIFICFCTSNLYAVEISKGVETGMSFEQVAKNLKKYENQTLKRIGTDYDSTLTFCRVDDSKSSLYNFYNNQLMSYQYILPIDRKNRKAVKKKSTSFKKRFENHQGPVKYKNIYYYRNKKNYDLGYKIIIKKKTINAWTGSISIWNDFAGKNKAAIFPDMTKMLIEKRGGEYFDAGVKYQKKGDSKNALDNFNKGVLELEKLAEITRELGLGYYFISIVYLEQNELTKADGAITKFIDIMEQIGTKNDELAEMISTFGCNARDNGPDLALKYYSFAIKRYKKENDKGEDIGTAYNSIANIYLEHNQLYRAKKYCKKGIAVMNKANIGGHELGHLYDTFGDIYKKKNKLKNSLEYYLKAAKELEEHNVQCRTGLHYTYANIGNHYKGQKQYKLALEYLKKALVEANKYNEYEKYEEIQKSLKEVEKSLGIKPAEPSNTEKNIIALENMGWEVYDTPREIVTLKKDFHQAPGSKHSAFKKLWKSNANGIGNILNIESPIINNFLDDNNDNDEIIFFSTTRKHRVIMCIRPIDKNIGKRFKDGDLYYYAIKTLTEDKIKYIRKALYYHFMDRWK